MNVDNLWSETLNEISDEKNISDWIANLDVKGKKDIRRLNTSSPAFTIKKLFVTGSKLDQWQFYINTRAYGKGIKLFIKHVESSTSYKFKTFNDFEKKIDKIVNKLYF